MLAEDSNPRVYVFSSCNEKIKAIVAQPTTTEIKRDWIGFPRGKENFLTKQGRGINQ